MSALYEVYALRYAQAKRLRKDNFLFPTEGDNQPSMNIDFFVWLIVGSQCQVLVDTGFSPASSQQRQRAFDMPPQEILRRMGLVPEAIKDLILTHLHFDHAGGLAHYPQARIWLQQKEMQYVTGPEMSEPRQNHFFSSCDISSLIERLFLGQVHLIDGVHELYEGIELHWVGGHTAGLQVVRVRTARGWVVLCSDAAHYYENLEKKNPFPALYNLEQMLAGFERIEQLASSKECIVAGHDPLVCQRFAPSPFIDRVGKIGEGGAGQEVKQGDPGRLPIWRIA